MTQRAIRFLHPWLDRNDLLDGRPVDDGEISELANRLFTEAEAEGISDKEISEKLARGPQEPYRHHPSPPRSARAKAIVSRGTAGRPVPNGPSGDRY
ncbi:DUF768 domain-containing protein [Mesorhizobium sp. B2-1-3A]|uniref:DUF768 domain-containing protein n=1 Tax=Mesorhizobium sp. B2-1-3A TaxID=2589971 RepID=UPI001127441D|nr:DUF768 domain-containing protein [Mesorhizobium sp. B2-1-3A]TPM94919.1 DUF768 domain-containing protein [Mesorhizobium sp. B2-1-3A]